MGLKYDKATQTLILIPISNEVHQQLKQDALARGKGHTLQELVAEILENYVMQTMVR